MSKIKEVNASTSQTDSLQFKYDFDDDYFVLNTQMNTRSSRGRKSTTNASTSIDSSELQQAYNELLAIPKPLYTDLMSLCNTEAIPRYYQEFYRSLKCEDPRAAQAFDTEDENTDDE